jgi:hypothetical protein
MMVDKFRVSLKSSIYAEPVPFLTEVVCPLFTSFPYLLPTHREADESS